MRNDPAPKEYLKLGLSPLHSRVMKLFDSLQDDNHECAMDNLYNSATFCKAAVNHPRKVRTHGVARKGMRGVPKCVTQEEVKNKKKQIEVRGTVKAAVLEGDPDCVGLVALSVYDTKPVHYLSMACQKIEWIVKEKLVYNVDSGCSETLQFLRLNQIDNYNAEMGNVDLADQLRGSYRLDHGVRNRKWWWSILFWGVGVLLTNAYIVYCKVNRDAGVKKLLSHHDFREEIATAWINMAYYKKERALKDAVAAAVKKRITGPDSGVSSLTNTTATRSTRSMTSAASQVVTKSITDLSLDPTHGAHACCLVPELHHDPMKKYSKTTRYGLHRYATGKEIYADVIRCSVCHVNLCFTCWRIFHKVPDIVNQKKRLLPDENVEDDVGTTKNNRSSKKVKVVNQVEV